MTERPKRVNERANKMKANNKHNAKSDSLELAMAIVGCCVRVDRDIPTKH